MNNYRPFETVEEKNSILGKKIKHKDETYYSIVINISHT